MSAEPAPPLAEPAPAAATPAAVAPTAAQLRRTKLSLPLVSAYGAGTLVDSVMSGALGLYLFFYVTAVCGLPNSLAGLSIFLGLLIDSMVDPIVGSLSDNTHSRLGRRHPFMFAAALPLAILLGVIFSIPTGLHGWGLFAFVTLVAIALRICHSCFNLPYVALGAELTDDYNERTTVVSARFLVAPIGTTAIILLGTGFFLYGPKVFHHAAYLPMGWTLGAITLIGAVIATFGTLPALKRLHQVKARGGNAFARTWADVLEIFRNRSFVSLFACLILIFTAAGVAGVLGLHAYKFFWDLPPGMIPIVQLAAVPGAFIGAIVSLVVVPKFEKRTVVIVGLVLFAALQAWLPLLRNAGLLASGPLVDGLLMLNAATITFVTAGVSIAFQSAMADAADEHEHLFGTRREGLYFAGLNFSAKAAVGLGSLIAGIGLDLIHFPTAIASQPDAIKHIRPEVIRNLGLLFGPGPAAITAVAVLIFIGYRLTKAQHATIQAELNARRAAAENI
ncbi:MAG TPA: MFS transporter [Caulobacteraceae bacterium]|nr:MFS transporter [Caulobacteraceae bacterium]